MTTISTLEQLDAFTRSGAPRATITGDLAAKIANTVAFNPGAGLPITYERKEHREMGGNVIAVTEVHWVHFGSTKIDLGQILEKLGVDTTG